MPRSGGRLTQFPLPAPSKDIAARHPALNAMGACALADVTVSRRRPMANEGLRARAGKENFWGTVWMTYTHRAQDRALQ
jgi:hypothetical protein